jgi:hypothetical protein
LRIDKSGLAYCLYCIALRVVGAVLVVFLRRWHKICTVLQPMRSKGRYPGYLKKCQKPSCPKESKETWTKYTLLTLLSQRCAKFTFCVIKSVEDLKNYKNWPHPLFRPRTYQACHQKLNTSRGTVTLIYL